MTPAEAEATLSRLFGDLNGYQLSHQDRALLSSKEQALIYGEVVPDSFQQVLSAAQPKPGEVFVDLGSGTGKALILADLFFDFSLLWGVEILPGLAAAAQSRLSRYLSELRPSLKPGRANRMEIHQGDFLSAQLPEADVVFTHSQCFGQALCERLAVKLAELKPGARLVTIGAPFPGPCFLQTGVMPCRMDWGPAVANLHLRTEVPG